MGNYVFLEWLMNKRKIIKYSVAVVFLFVVCIVDHFAYQTYKADDVYARIGGSEWVGRWQSEEIGDGGKLKLKFERVGDKFRTVWLAEHYGVCKAAFDELIGIVEQADGSVVIKGKIDLGLSNGGTFNYAGVIKDDTLDMTWESSTDSGTLKLKLVGRK